MLKDDKISDLELDFINYVMKKKIQIFLIGNKISEIDDKKKRFQRRIKNYNKFDEEKKTYLINHLFFVDLLAEKCVEINKILLHTVEAFSKSKKSHEEIIIKFEKFLSEQQFSLSKKPAPPAEEHKLLEKEEKNENIIHIDPELNKNQNIKDEKELEKLNEDFSKLCKDSIFLRENVEEFRNKKKEEAMAVVWEFQKSNFGWGMIPIPILDKRKTGESRLKMINQIFKIYNPVFELIKRQKKEVNKVDENETQIPRAVANAFGDLSLFGGVALETLTFFGVVKWFVPKFVSGSVGLVFTLVISLATGYKSYKDAGDLGTQIIHILEQEFTKLNAYEIYYDSAKKYNKAICLLEEFASNFDDKHEIKYDINIDEEYKNENTPQPFRKENIPKEFK